MMLVEVAPIINAAARAHHVKAWQVRDGDDGERVRAAREQAMREMRQAGMTLRGIGELLGCAHTAVRAVAADIDVGGRARRGVLPGKRCSRCAELKCLDEFARNVHSTDLRQSACRDCTRECDRAYRRREFRRRANGEARHNTNVRLRVEVHELLKDTAERHGVTMATIVERSVAKTLACKDCRKRLRRMGSDYCLACDQQWEVVSA